MVSGIAVIITIFIFLLLFGALFFVIYWILGKFGIWKWATYRRLRRRYKNVDLSEEAIKWAMDKIFKKWKFKDVKKFVGYEKESGELLYTYMTLCKLSQYELDRYKEVDDDGQAVGRTEEETKRTFPKFPKNTDI